MASNVMTFDHTALSLLLARHRRTELARLSRALTLIRAQMHDADNAGHEDDGNALFEATHLCRSRISALQQAEALACAPWFEARQ